VSAAANSRFAGVAAKREEQFREADEATARKAEQARERMQEVLQRQEERKTIAAAAVPKVAAALIALLDQLDATGLTDDELVDCIDHALEAVDAHRGERRVHWAQPSVTRRRLSNLLDTMPSRHFHRRVWIALG
jgi:hypothetical protein